MNIYAKSNILCFSPKVPAAPTLFLFLFSYFKKAPIPCSAREPNPYRLSVTTLPLLHSILSRLSRITSWPVLKPLALPFSASAFHHPSLKAILFLCRMLPDSPGPRALSCLSVDNHSAHCLRSRGTKGLFINLTNIC